MIPFIDLQTQRRRIASEVDTAVRKVLEHGQYIMGPEVSTLEAELAAYAGVRHAISCANGTDALVLALRALGIGAGDAVFAPSFTFVATAEAIALVGATPVFVDVREDTFNLCIESLAAAIEATNRAGTITPKAIMPVDLFGQPADYAEINRLAETHGLQVIADAAQSFGASTDERRVGSLATISTTSFFPAKPLGCYGDGGAVFTDDDETAHILKSVRSHGQGQEKYENIRLGTNSRLDTLQAAILLEKMKIFPEEIGARDAVARRYSSGLPNAFQPPVVMSGATSAWAQYTVVCDDPETFRDGLKERGVPTAVYYPRPIHQQPPYRHFEVAPAGLPVTEALRDRVFSLPMHPYLDETTQGTILDGLHEIASN